MKSQSVWLLYVNGAAIDGLELQFPHVVSTPRDGRARRTIIHPARAPQRELNFVKPNLMGRDRCRLTSSSMHLITRMPANEKLEKI
jgi:hypothetical protein